MARRPRNTCEPPRSPPRHERLTRPGAPAIPTASRSANAPRQAPTSIRLPGMRRTQPTEAASRSTHATLTGNALRPGHQLRRPRRDREPVREHERRFGVERFGERLDPLTARDRLVVADVADPAGRWSASTTAGPARVVRVPTVVSPATDERRCPPHAPSSRALRPNQGRRSTRSGGRCRARRTRELRRRRLGVEHRLVVARATVQRSSIHSSP